MSVITNFQDNREDYNNYICNKTHQTRTLTALSPIILRLTTEWRMNSTKSNKIGSFLFLFNRSWRISTTLNTTKIFLIIFKLIQQSIMVILSCLVKKNQNLNSRKKSSVYYWKLRFQGRNACKLPSNSNFDFSLPDNSEWP